MQAWSDGRIYRRSQRGPVERRHEGHTQCARRAAEAVGGGGRCHGPVGRPSIRSQHDAPHTTTIRPFMKDYVRNGRRPAADRARAVEHVSIATVHVGRGPVCVVHQPRRQSPKATNKTSVSAAGDFPVQNGKADFTLSATAFQPECSPPMTVVFTDVNVTDTTNGLAHSFPGTF